MRVFRGLLTGLLLLLIGCSDKPKDYYYFIAVKNGMDPPFASKMTMIQRFETQSWCESSAKRYEEKEGFASACERGRTEFDPMFEAKGVGQWYAIQSYGKFPPVVIIYEFTPPIPDQYMLNHLRQIRPHSLQFAAFHNTPAEVSIVSPDGEIF